MWFLVIVFLMIVSFSAADKIPFRAGDKVSFSAGDKVSFNAGVGTREVEPQSVVGNIKDQMLRKARTTSQKHRVTNLRHGLNQKPKKQI